MDNNTNLPNLTLKIDVSKIDKDLLFQGEKGLYMTCYVRPTPNSQYNDFLVVQAVKDGENIILGNADVKEFDKKEKRKPRKASPSLPWE